MIIVSAIERILSAIEKGAPYDMCVGKLLELAERKVSIEKWREEFACQDRRKGGLRAAAESIAQLARGMNDSLGTMYDYVTSVHAVQSPTYNVVVPTLADSSSAGLPWSVFLVSAHIANPNVYYLSPLDSGYSVDNLIVMLNADDEIALPLNGKMKKG